MRHLFNLLSVATAAVTICGCSSRTAEPISVSQQIETAGISTGTARTVRHSGNLSYIYLPSAAGTDIKSRNYPIIHVLTAAGSHKKSYEKNFSPVQRNFSDLSPRFCPDNRQRQTIVLKKDPPGCTILKK